MLRRKYGEMYQLWVPIKKERDNDSGETITYKIKFTDSCRFMPSKLSNLVDNLS